MKKNKRKALSFHQRAKLAGWTLVNEYGFWDGILRQNPDKSYIYDGCAVYSNDEGVLADAWYVAERIGL